MGTKDTLVHFIQSIILDPVPKSNLFTILQHRNKKHDYKQARYSTICIILVDHFLKLIETIPLSYRPFVLDEISEVSREMLGVLWPTDARLGVFSWMCNSLHDASFDSRF